MQARDRAGCAQCDGRGWIFLSFPTLGGWSRLPCSICDGTGAAEPKRPSEAPRVEAAGS
jgi:hypothetical protein